jgi:CHC2 zinc finger/Toprim domain
LLVEVIGVSADLLDRAKQADIREVAGRYTTLKRVTAIEGAGPCPVCGGRDRFSVNGHKQVWNCRGCDRGGDVIALMQHVEGLPFREAVERLTGERGPAPRPHDPPRRPTPREDEGDKHALHIAGLIVGGIAPLRGTPGETCLREVRKIDTGEIAEVLERTDAIGWNPSVLLREEGHPLDGKRLGAIIGVMTDPVTAEPTGAISRTYIHEGRKVGKAKTLGSPAGIIRLTPDEDVLGRLHIAEGLETALAGMSIGLRPTWATGSTAIMAKLPVVSWIEALFILADHDANGAGERAGAEVASRWREAGKEARVWRPKSIGDLNDILIGGAK